MTNKTAIIITLIICLTTLLMAIMKFIIQYAQIKADTEINKELAKPSPFLKLLGLDK